MARGLTIAEFVQQVLYAIYKVRLDVDGSLEGSFHSKSDKFKEIVMEANFVLQEFQKEQDWSFLRDRWDMGIALNPHGGIQEFELSDDVYKVCTGYGDAVRLHPRKHGGFSPMAVSQIPYTEARTGNVGLIKMYDDYGRLNMPDSRVHAFFVGDTISFTRPWFPNEEGCLVETDVIRRIEPLHICDDNCDDNCPLAYKDKVLSFCPDPLYLILKTAAYRAEGDPSAIDRAQPLADQAQKMLSAMRENDSSHTVPDTYETMPFGFTGVM